MSSAEDRQNELVAKLIERLLVEPELRAAFRRDPAQACLDAGLPELAAELGPSGKAMHTLQLRESKSSLAGVVSLSGCDSAAIKQAEAAAAPAESSADGWFS